ncbi:ATP-binding protein [Streptomyces sp. NPDC050508]|uniref:ATP-binding protein n=1 Tax=Streptomyces sp. NPDC050508 TaxID=3155405 RepID=UPI0034442335
MSILERPELPPGATALTSSERCAIALAAIGHRSGEIAGKLLEAGLPVPATGLGLIWSGAANKLGSQRNRPQGRQPELVFRARVHGLLDAPDPDDPGWLPPDILAFVQALARGRTLKEYALVDLQVSVWEVDEIASRARKMLGRPPTQACLVYRALPQLLRTVQPPVEEPLTDLRPAEGPSPITISFQTELPYQEGAVRMGRWWIRGCLPALNWDGPVLEAVGVVSHLVDNALRHGLPRGAVNESRIVLRAAVTEAGELVLDVIDPNPSFPGFAAARTGESGVGLRRVAELGARLTWFLHSDGSGKTVRAVLAPGPISP